MDYNVGQISAGTREVKEEVTDTISSARETGASILISP
jgi:hypothetical protein